MASIFDCSFSAYKNNKIKAENLVANKPKSVWIPFESASNYVI